MEFRGERIWVGLGWVGKGGRKYVCMEVCDFENEIIDLGIARIWVCTGLVVIEKLV